MALKITGSKVISTAQRNFPFQSSEGLQATHGQSPGLGQHGCPGDGHIHLALGSPILAGWAPTESLAPHRTLHSSPEEHKDPVPTPTCTTGHSPEASNLESVSHVSTATSGLANEAKKMSTHTCGALLCSVVTTVLSSSCFILHEL